MISSENHPLYLYGFQLALERLGDINSKELISTGRRFNEAARLLPSMDVATGSFFAGSIKAIDVLLAFQKIEEEASNDSDI